MSKVHLVRRAQALFGSVLFTLATVAGSLAWLPTKALAFAGGDGQSAETAWQISSCAELQSLNTDAAYADDFFELSQSFSCSGISDFNPIDFGEALAFGGTFDGKGFTISDLTMDTDRMYVALFVQLQNATVTNVVFDDASIDNDDSSYTAILAGSVLTSTISNITVTDSTVGVVSDSSRTGGLVAESLDSSYDNISMEAEVWADPNAGNMVGGLIGRSIHDEVSNVTIAAGAVAEEPQISGDQYVGGIMGTMMASDIEDSVSNAYVSGDTHVGGMVGLIYVTGENSNGISNSSATGEVFGYLRVGGLVGTAVNDESNGVEYVISDSSATGQVTGSGQAGGFIGDNGGAEIYNSYATGDVVAVACECGPIGGFVGRQASENGLDGYIHESFATGSVDPEDSGVWYSGSFVGEMDGGIIENAYARGNINGYQDYGGFVGWMRSGAITNVYSAGAVTPDTDDRGLVGTYEDGTIIESFWDTETSGQETSQYGTGLTTEQATTRSTYENAGWDFTEGPIWGLVSGVNDSYPCLIFQEGCIGDEPSDEDLNGDETPDVDQPNIGGYVSSFTGKTVAIDVGEGCELTTDDMTRESLLDVQDATYDYDNGLWEFEAECSEGATTTIKMYYYNVDPSGLVLRKHNDITGAYFNVPGAVITTQTINGSSVALVTYQITDNGDLDLEKEDVGMIRDPAGLARSLVGAPNTGLRR